MPKLSVWAVRLSLVYFVVGTALGAVLLAGKAVALPVWWWALRPAHVEALLFGFVVQLAFGVAYWILPKTRGQTSERPVVLALVLLNAGVVLVAVAAVSVYGLAVAGRVCEAAAVVAFAGHIWSRVRPAVSRPAV